MADNTQLDYMLHLATHMILRMGVEELVIPNWLENELIEYVIRWDNNTDATTNERTHFTVILKAELIEGTIYKSIIDFGEDLFWINIKSLLGDDITDTFFGQTLAAALKKRKLSPA